MIRSAKSEYATDAFDNLAQGLANAGRDELQTLSLVSANRREGTSTCVLNLARHLADFHDQDVLLVDANLRNPVLHGILDSNNDKGLAELISGEAQLEQTVRSTGAPRLDLLPAGTPVAHPNRLLVNLDIEALFAPRASSYRYILFDAPPVNLYSDALEIGTQCDATALVVQAEKTRREVIHHAKSQLLSSGCKVIGVILNKRKYHIPELLYKLV